MIVIFAHGKEGSPNGKKATFLREHFDAITPDLHGKPLAEQVEILNNLIIENEDCLIVGSSMGGAACTLAALKTPPKKMLLLAPALNYAECKIGIPVGFETRIVHGTNDDIIPHKVSEEASEVSGAHLTLVDDCHRLMLSKEVIIEEVEKLLA